MMGRREGGQGQFFYSFKLDEVVPPDHLVRQIDGVLDLGWVHKELAPYYSHTGRPSIDPVLMIRMLIVGYVFAIRSERRLCAEVQVNLAYRWFCKLGIEDKIPDHSVFCRARHERFRESDALRRVFEGVVAMCIAAGLVGGEAFSVDASLIKADVDKKKRVPGEQPIAWPKTEEASRAVREYLAALDAAGGDAPFGRNGLEPPGVVLLVGGGVEAGPVLHDRLEVAVVVDVACQYVEIDIVLVAVDGALARAGKNDELVTHVAADRTGLGLHRNRLQPHAREGAQIAGKELVVGALGSLEVDVEAVGVLHQELAAASS